MYIAHLMPSPLYSILPVINCTRLPAFFMITWWRTTFLVFFVSLVPASFSDHNFSAVLFLNSEFLMTIVVALQNVFELVFIYEFAWSATASAPAIRASWRSWTWMTVTICALKKRVRKIILVISDRFNSIFVFSVHSIVRNTRNTRTNTFLKNNLFLCTYWTE